MICVCRMYKSFALRLYAGTKLFQDIIRSTKYFILTFLTPTQTRTNAAYPWLYNNMLTGVALHLKPMPYLDGTLALRVLGKLGGHNQALATTELPQTCGDWTGADDSEVCIVCRCFLVLRFLY
jgi:hypothetical protein